MEDELRFGKIDDYLKQWKRNRQLCGKIDRAYVDWQITVVFYTALHAINAAAAKLGEKPCNHTARNNLVKGNQAFAPVRQNYLLLYRLSRFTRYDPDPDSWLPAQFLTAQGVVDQVLAPIERHVVNIIGKKIDLPPIGVMT